jgi:hypothetical protein
MDADTLASWLNELNDPDAARLGDFLTAKITLP